MKNYEKYAEDIREFDGTCFCNQFVAPHVLKSVNCHEMDCTRCRMLQVMWMLEEYKEPKEPETDWSKVEVDTPILVRDYEGQEWARRYFAEHKCGTVYAWDCGRTSWTGDGVTEWEYAKLAESGEE